MPSIRTLTVAAALLASGLSAHAQAPAKVADDILVGPNDMTLYTFDKDTPGTSACNEACAANWPPLQASNSDADTGDYTVVTREDGSKQWAYKGQPLYYWARDNQPGDRTGDGIKDVWHAATP